MYRKILVGYDGHEHARDALALARGLAAIEGAELILVAALELDPLATPADAYERATAETEDRLSTSAREVLEGTPFELRTFGGVAAARALSEFAEAEHADVIVLGSTHRGGLGRVLPGSVGEHLLHGAPCAVLIAPIGFADRDRLEIASIGVGFDGRNQAGHARDVANGLAADLGASVETITVAEGRRRSGRSARRALRRPRPAGRRITQSRAGATGAARQRGGRGDAQGGLSGAGRAAVGRRSHR